MNGECKGRYNVRNNLSTTKKVTRFSNLNWWKQFSAKTTMSCWTTSFCNTWKPTCVFSHKMVKFQGDTLLSKVWKYFLEKFKCEYFITKNVSYNSINIVYCLSSLNARKTCVLIYKSCLTISTNKSCLTISTKFVVLFEHLNARKTCVCFIFKSCFTTLTKLVKLFEYFKAKKHGRQLQLNLLCCLSISAQEKLVWSWHL